MRSLVFRDNWEFIQRANAQEGRTFNLGVNKFADWTREERRLMSRGLTTKRVTTGVMRERPEGSSFDYGILPQKVDWR
jgi:hypothetical protein